jgi:hypothetical protein
MHAHVGAFCVLIFSFIPNYNFLLLNLLWQQFHINFLIIICEDSDQLCFVT